MQRRSAAAAAAAVGGGPAEEQPAGLASSSRTRRARSAAAPSSQSGTGKSKSKDATVIAVVMLVLVGILGYVHVVRTLERRAGIPVGDQSSLLLADEKAKQYGYQHLHRDKLEQAAAEADRRQHQEQDQGKTKNEKQRLRASERKGQRADRTDRDGATAEQLQRDDGTGAVLVLKTDSIGSIRIKLRMEYSKESLAYVRELVDRGCEDCRLYRAEKPAILQGVMGNQDVPVPKQRGSCPEGFESVPNDCPEWDRECGCHGPVMERGMVAWAAGATGPDFFIDNDKRKADWWGTQHTGTSLFILCSDVMVFCMMLTFHLSYLPLHRLICFLSFTVFGQIDDDASFGVIDKVWMLPTIRDDNADMTFLKDPIEFEIELLQQ